MPITVQGPNGETINFPDGMGMDQITGIMRQHFGGPVSQPQNPAYTDKQRQIDAQANPDKIIAGAAAAKKDADANDYVGGLARSSMQGTGFGLGDEAMAGARSLVNGENYDEALADERARLATFREAHPYLSYGTEIASGAALPGGAAADALKAGTTAARILKTGAGIGGATGALYGFGSGEGGVGNRLENSAVNTAIGAGTGAVIPSAVNLLSRTGGAIAGAVRNVANPEAAATRDIVAAAQQANLPMGQIAQHMGTPNGSAVPLNMLDASQIAAEQQGRYGAELPMLNLARNATGTGGSAEGMAAEALAGRQRNQNDRLSNLFDSTTGNDYNAEVARLDGILQNQSRQAYEQAHANARPYKIDPVLQSYSQKYAPLLATDSNLGNGMRKALEMFSERPNGQGPTISTLPQYMAVRESLDQMIADSASSLGKPTPLTAKLTELRSAVNGPVRQANPLLAQADNLYHGTRTAQDVLALGQDSALKAGENQRDAMQQFSRMTPVQQDLFRTGVKQKLMDSVANMNSGSTNASKQFDRAAFQSFVRRVFPGQESQKILNEVQRELASTKSSFAVFSNSRTTPMGYQMQGLADDAQIAGHALALNPAGVARGIGSKVARAFNGAKSEAIIRQMTSIDPAATQPVINEMAKGAQAAQNRAARKSALMSALIGLTPRAAVQNKE